jgi:hypothetical protein
MGISFHRGGDTAAARRIRPRKPGVGTGVRVQLINTSQISRDSLFTPNFHPVAQLGAAWVFARQRRCAVPQPGAAGAGRALTPPVTALIDLMLPHRQDPGRASQAQCHLHQLVLVPPGCHAA